MADSDPAHRAVSKNGKDRLQDSAIRELTGELRAHISEEMGHHRLVENEVQSLGSEIKKYVFAGRVAWTFLGILGAGVVAYQANLDIKVRELESRVDDLQSKQHAFEERGTRWGQDLDRNVLDIKQDIREIRRRINGGK